MITLVTKNKLKTVTISGKELRIALLGNEAGTKQEMAELLAKKFPAELASRLPSKRKSWQSEDARMDIFEAVELSLTVCKN